MVEYFLGDLGIAPFKILEESKRVLRQGGAIHLLVDTYSYQFTVYRKILRRIMPDKRDKKHPHCLGFKSITKYLRHLGCIELKSYHGESPYSQVFRRYNGSIECSL